MLATARRLSESLLHGGGHSGQFSSLAAELHLKAEEGSPGILDELLQRGLCKRRKGLMLGS
jgi:hypothetical protein